MTLSAFLVSVLSGNTHAQEEIRASNDVHDHRSRSPILEQEDLWRCKTYRKFFPMTEIALPATALGIPAIAKWARDHRLAIEVRTGEDLAAAIAAGVHPARVTVFADALRGSELRAVANLGVGRVVAGSVQQIEVLRSVVTQPAQDVVIGMTDSDSPVLAGAGGHDPVPAGFRFDSNEADRAIAAVIDHEWLNLVGLQCEVGAQDHDFVSYPAAIGHMIAEMAQIRRNHDQVLTRLGLGGAHGVPCGEWAVALPQRASQIDESLDDACGTLRFPRPLVVLSAGFDIIGRSSA